jgi:hypothetical protein
VQTAQNERRRVRYVSPSLGRQGIPAAPGAGFLIPKMRYGACAQPREVILGYGAHEIGIVVYHMYVIVQNAAGFRYGILLD